MAKIERFEDLKCWQEARELVKTVYMATGEDPFAKDFSMKDQIRRASISVMNNIAEGFGRFSDKEFIRFLEMSSASACEVKSICYVAMDVNYWSKDIAIEVQNRSEKVKALSLGLVKYLKGDKR
jgi:four helix bundle protein